MEMSQEQFERLVREVRAESAAKVLDAAMKASLNLEAAAELVEKVPSWTQAMQNSAQHTNRRPER